MQTVKLEEKYIEVPGGQVFVRSWLPDKPSEKAAIVLLHDSLGCVELWRDFPEQLATRFGRKVVAYDRLGFGRSSAVTEPPSLTFIDEEAEVVFPALCSALGLEKVVLFGHSVGGGMAIAIASIHSQASLCTSVITESAQAFVETRTKRGIETAKKYFNKPAHLDKLTKYHGDKARWVLDAWTETWLHPAFKDWNLKSHLKNLNCPVLAIHGDNDEYGSLAFPKLIVEESAGYSQQFVLQGIGHVPHKENTTAVLTAVTGFLSKIERSDVAAVAV